MPEETKGKPNKETIWLPPKSVMRFVQETKAGKVQTAKKSKRRIALDKDTKS